MFPPKAAKKSQGGALPTELQGNINELPYYNHHPTQSTTHPRKIVPNLLNLPQDHTHQSQHHCRHQCCRKPLHLKTRHPIAHQHNHSCIYHQSKQAQSHYIYRQSQKNKNRFEQHRQHSPQHRYHQQRLPPFYHHPRHYISHHIKSKSVHNQSHNHILTITHPPLILTLL